MLARLLKDMSYFLFRLIVHNLAYLTVAIANRCKAYYSNKCYIACSCAFRIISKNFENKRVISQLSCQFPVALKAGYTKDSVSVAYYKIVSVPWDTLSSSKLCLPHKTQFERISRYSTVSFMCITQKYFSRTSCISFVLSPVWSIW